MFVYSDNAATMPLSREAFEAMLPFLRDNFGNASSVYGVAREAARALHGAREDVARALGAKPEEIYFTGGGTESDNWALKGAAEARRARGRHIVTTAIEHHAVLHTAEYLGRQGCEITLLPVDERGLVSPEQVRDALRPDTALVSVMLANNEIGTIEPIREIAAVTRAHGALFHTDAVQAVGHIPVDVTELGVDLLSLAGHKFGGPKGVGALYIRKGVRLPPLLHGGGHERGLRSGTENVAGAVGLAAALTRAVQTLPETMALVAARRARVIDGLSRIPFSLLTGDPVRRLPGNISFVFEAVEGESLVLGLDMVGVCASSGSACSSGSLDPSHVLLAIGLPHEVAHGSLRLTISENNTEEEIDYLIEQVTNIVARSRRMSPLWNEETQSPTERFWPQGVPASL
ncbi:MAG: aminotransferase class V-fold PLP-dependent enzyme [Oscillospiraceae bacterium]|jgi:cysteine desulfurase|nr:aminotransferase class V-fold PLP-dependent enzyme [Oscillospiraceae bacterium]